MEPEGLHTSRLVVNVDNSRGLPGSDLRDAGTGRTPHHPKSSVAFVTLFEPRVAAVVIPANFPESRLVVVENTQARNPFCALPEVQVGNQQTRRTTVIAWQRFAVDL